MRKYKLKELRELVRLGDEGICENGNIKAVEACILYC